MRRREFLKLTGAALVAPGVLAKPKPKYTYPTTASAGTTGWTHKKLTLKNLQEYLKEHEIGANLTCDDYVSVPIGQALQDIPRDGYDWVQVAGPVTIGCTGPIPRMITFVET